MGVDRPHIASRRCFPWGRGTISSGHTFHVRIGMSLDPQTVAKVSFRGPNSHRSSCDFGMTGGLEDIGFIGSGENTLRPSNILAILSWHFFPKAGYGASKVLRYTLSTPEHHQPLTSHGENQKMMGVFTQKNKSPSVSILDHLIP